MKGLIPRLQFSKVISAPSINPPIGAAFYGPINSGNVGASANNIGKVNGGPYDCYFTSAVGTETGKPPYIAANYVVCGSENPTITSQANFTVYGESPYDLLESPIGLDFNRDRRPDFSFSLRNSTMGTCRTYVVLGPVNGDLFLVNDTRVIKIDCENSNDGVGGAYLAGASNGRLAIGLPTASNCTVYEIDGSSNWTSPQTFNLRNLDIQGRRFVGNSNSAFANYQFCGGQVLYGNVSGSAAQDLFISGRYDSTFYFYNGVLFCVNGGITWNSSTISLNNNPLITTIFGSQISQFFSNSLATLRMIDGNYRLTSCTPGAGNPAISNCIIFNNFGRLPWPRSFFNNDSSNTVLTGGIAPSLATIGDSVFGIDIDQDGADELVTNSLSSETANVIFLNDVVPGSQQAITNLLDGVNGFTFTGFLSYLFNGGNFNGNGPTIMLTAPSATPPNILGDLAGGVVYEYFNPAIRVYLGIINVPENGNFIISIIHINAINGNQQQNIQVNFLTFINFQCIFTSGSFASIPNLQQGISCRSLGGQPSGNISVTTDPTGTVGSTTLPISLLFNLIQNQPPSSGGNNSIGGIVAGVVIATVVALIGFAVWLNHKRKAAMDQINKSIAAHVATGQNMTGIFSSLAENITKRVNYIKPDSDFNEALEEVLNKELPLRGVTPVENDVDLIADAIMSRKETACCGFFNSISAAKIRGDASDIAGEVAQKLHGSDGSVELVRTTAGSVDNTMQMRMFS